MTSLTDFPCAVIFASHCVRKSFNSYLKSTINVSVLLTFAFVFKIFQRNVLLVVGESCPTDQRMQFVFLCHQQKLTHLLFSTLNGDQSLC